ncbi:TRAP-type mannitol/chloroaromatic compound transport system, substrate-binding protein [Roseovarius azorensis]|uniref:TRAP-type mannitol/chloroaromatic compound transport system, substrate-binding protein n=1 Tax=Roseovarius azorensis TaxID=1287727 RepID=A0A1H7QEL0_9RHOB|nr:TRAP transporter substrate-binding protein DctP [Roseovarius azorensis]SEL46422.1 TRAP-type mannitol/chloroaromatic compound transport system, substrate-binding protein [Roseovarius azorensis]
MSNQGKGKAKEGALGRRRFLTTGAALASGGAASAVFGAPTVARAQENITWRIQTHYSSGSPAGVTFQRFIDNVATMSGGRLTMEPYTSSALVKITEAASATRSGILDADMSWAGYGIGLDPAFQFFADINGAYTIPEQPQYWLDHEGGRELADELFHSYGLHLVGFWGTIPESLVSTVPLPNLKALKGFRLRSPLGLQGEVLSAFGAEPIVMDFGEVFTALDTGIVDGADAAELRVNDSLGLHEVAKHVTYPGFHAMPWVHLAVNKDKWDALGPDLQKIVEIALKKAAHERGVEDRVLNDLVATQLKEKGVSVHTWPEEEMSEFRKIARPVWEAYAEANDMSKRAYASHATFMEKIGIIS